ncbi:5'-3' exonuclease [Staphylococcus hsinchuensis]|uniref:5'-3' exonuclease n=1 Tax=Staphylococcus hsinchuensis TaxID=3051183 RepID=A0ABZ3EBA0_9STAP
MANRILLVDGMALLFRHFYATSIHKQFMRNSSGTPTNAIQGVLRHVYTAIHEINPTHVAICWDMGKVTFRNDMFEGYKQNRPQPPEELIPQFDKVKAITEELGFVNIGIDHYEADDVIGTLAHEYSTSNEVYVITGDRDILQCLNDNVEIWLTKKGFNIYNRYTLDRFKEEYELNPKQLVDVKAFMGDPSDGYPGVKGIGEKTAIKLIRQYDTVESVLDSLHELTPGQRSKIEANIEDLKLSKTLAQIHLHVPISTTPLLERMDYKNHKSLAEILNICENHELKVTHKYLVANFK